MYPSGLDNGLALSFLESKIEWVLRARQRIASRQAVRPHTVSDEERKRLVERLRREAKADLPARLSRLSEAAGLPFGRLTIRASRTRWGSCSWRNDISLSLYMMILPEYLRDFVILHELCHTRIKDHSPRFHAMLDGLLGGREREFAAQLRRYSADMA